MPDSVVGASMQHVPFAFIDISADVDFEGVEVINNPYMKEKIEEYSADSSIYQVDVGGQNRLVCNGCGHLYANIRTLKRHIRVECNLEPQNQCPYCDVMMKQRTHIYRHIKRRHKGSAVYAIDPVSKQPYPRT